MWEKRKNFITVVLLALCLGGFALWAAVKPADELSLSERRQLTQRPALSLSAVMDGSFMTKAEDYALDQFPLRERFRSLKAAVSFYVLRQKDNNGVYLADGYAAKLEYPMDESSLDYAAKRFQYLYDTYLAQSGGNLYLSVIPDKNAFLAAENGYPALDLDAFIQTVRDRTPYLTYLDITGLLSLEDYYRTDLHWRQENITDVAEYLAGEMGTDAAAEYEEQTLDRPYYGVYCGYAALPIGGEELHWLTNETLEGCTVYQYETGETTGIYDQEKGEGRDPYELFLSGSVPLVRIDNPAADTDKELILFRDSFGSSLAPLLVQGYRSITLVDIRYLAPAFLGNYVDFQGKDVLFLYSVSVLNNSETLR